MNKNNNGFSLIELLLALLILSIISATAYPVYMQHIYKIRRAEAQIVLLDLAARMEHYYIENNYSYRDATLDKLGISQISNTDSYQITISHITPTTYLLQATPQHAQTNDTACGTLTLNERGQKGQTGNGNSYECW